jgi:hypothetical protein
MHSEHEVITDNNVALREPPQHLLIERLIVQPFINFTFSCIIYLN